ncbi:unnamed protein product [Dibothriocephalus latus]|uniref:G-protein coupled receptors family 1 profile domain-containing protein n=1 Tax=Dibothriocephalus latus TaxID=60516 RepID=A0A3P7LH79_DIBLA|nr:unnamed protein product [Dibothriocephalus latus]
MAEPVISKTFWKCITRTDWPDFLDVLTFLLEITSILFNALAAVLLFKKHAAGPRVSLVLLRSMTTCYLLSATVNFIATVYPYKLRAQNYHFNRFVCLFWDSRFFYWIFSIMGDLSLATFSVDRFFTLAQLDRFRVTLPEYRSFTFVNFAVVSALLLSLPQLLTVNLQGDSCDCAPTQLIRWKLNRLPANHNWRNEDDLNGMAFKGQAAAAADTLISHHYQQCRSWSSASLCILPLAVSYALTAVYDSTYQFLSAFDEAKILARNDSRVSHELLESWSSGPQSINKRDDLAFPYEAQKPILRSSARQQDATSVLVVIEHPRPFLILPCYRNMVALGIGSKFKPTQVSYPCALWNSKRPATFRLFINDFAYDSLIHKATKKPSFGHPPSHFPVPPPPCPSKAIYNFFILDKLYAWHYRLNLVDLDIKASLVTSCDNRM